MAVVAALSPKAWAALPDGYNHPELKWRVVESPHFSVIFHQGEEDLAQRVAHIAEEAYPKVTGDLGVEPGHKTPILLADYSDEATSFATRQENWIYITAPGLNEARVNGDVYLQAVVRHEFTHVVTYWATRGKYGDVGQWLGPPVIPEWFLEGLANAQAYTLSLSQFLIMRAAALEDAINPLAKIDLDVRVDTVDGWLMYAQGHSLVSYMAQRFGTDVFKRILHDLAGGRVFEVGLHRVTGITEERLFADWKAEVRRAYEPLASLGDEAVKPAWNLPFEAVLAARLSPDGKKLAVVAVKDWEEPSPLLYLGNADGSGLKRVAGDLGIYASVKLAWAPDGSKVYYAGRRRLSNGSLRTGVYSVTVPGGRRTLLTSELRAADPTVSPDGKQIAFVAYDEHLTRLAVADADGANVRFLTGPADPYQVFSPSWSPDRKWIAFAAVFGPNSAISIIRPDGTGYKQITSGKYVFDLDPAWSPDGRQIAYTSFNAPPGATVAVPNICIADVTGARRWRISNLKSGSAFYPFWSPKGDKVYFTVWHTRRYVLYDADPTRAVQEMPPASEEIVSPASAGPLAFPGQPKEYLVVPYVTKSRVQHFLTRPTDAGDGYGSTLGLQTLVGDPLHLHYISALYEYGVDSELPHVNIRYTNSKRFPDLVFEAFDRVENPYPLGGTLVWDHNRGAAMGLRVRHNPNGYLYRQDVSSVTVGSSYRTPRLFSPPLSPPPSSNTLNSLVLQWQRSDLSPSRAQTNWLARYSLVGNVLGGDFNASIYAVNFTKQYRAPDVRHLLVLGANYFNYNGDTLAKTHTTQETSTGQVGFLWRLGDDWSTRGWPYFYGQRGTLGLTFFHTRRLSGAAPAVPTGNGAQGQLLLTGRLSRFFPFQVSATSTWYEKTNKVDTVVILRLFGLPLAPIN